MTAGERNSAYLRNAWYVAAWSEEVSPGHLTARTLLDQPIALFRDTDNRPQALLDRCPHRFAPLSMGRVLDGGAAIRCIYHGLEFDPTGLCRHNPHGAGAGRIRAAAFPAAERHGIVWIWMGEEARADRDLIPDFEFLGSDQSYVAKDYLAIEANYLLGNDNILDLSHADFLHETTLATGPCARVETDFKVEGPDVWSLRRTFGERLKDEAYEGLGLPRGELIDRAIDVRWSAPANLVIFSTLTLTSGDGKVEVEVKQSNFFTPATAGSTHYFYALSAPRSAGAHWADRIGQIMSRLRRPFVEEDKPVLEEIQRRLQGKSFRELRPALLPIDRAAAYARRELERRIKAETDEDRQTHA